MICYYFTLQTCIACSLQLFSIFVESDGITQTSSVMFVGAESFFLWLVSQVFIPASVVNSQFVF